MYSVLKLDLSVEKLVFCPSALGNSFTLRTRPESVTRGPLRCLYHQYSKARVTQARPMPTKITMNTPPGGERVEGDGGYGEVVKVRVGC